VKGRIFAATEGLLTILAATLLAVLLSFAAGVLYSIAIDGQSLNEVALLEPLVSGDGGPSADAGPPMSVGAIATAVSVQSIVFVAIGLGMSRWRMPRAPAARTSGFGAAVLWGAAGAAAAMVGAVVISATLAVLGFEIEEQAWLLQMARSDPWSMWRIAPWTVIVGPVAEEVMFRFYLFRFLDLRVGTAFAYIASASAFALIHFHPPALPLYLLYGLVLAWVYRRTSSLVAPVVAHVLINLIGTILLVVGASELSTG
jgi:membrane protease YdiL (CAAX protease family)